MSTEDIANLKAIQESISKIYSFIEELSNPDEFLNDTKTFDDV